VGIPGKILLAATSNISSKEMRDECNGLYLIGYRSWEY